MDFIEAKIYFAIFFSYSLACSSLWWLLHIQTRAHSISISYTWTLCSRLRALFAHFGRGTMHVHCTQTEYSIFDFILLSTT